MEDVDMFYGPFANVLSIWYILWPFGIFYGHLVLVSFSQSWNIFHPFGKLHQEKSGNPAQELKALQSKCSFDFVVQ
jgi:hypothetical protein